MIKSFSFSYTTVVIIIACLGNNNVLLVFFFGSCMFQPAFSKTHSVGILSTVSGSSPYGKGKADCETQDA